MSTISERFTAKHAPDTETGCWVWTAGRSTAGYGKIREDGRRGRTRHAHRVSYELHVGPIPHGLCVLHRCDNRPCVNPQHLFLGTPADNAHDMMRKGRAVYSPGELSGHAKLTEIQALNIIARRASGERCNALAAEFGVSHPTISRITRGMGWKHLPSANAFLTRGAP